MCHQGLLRGLRGIERGAGGIEFLPGDGAHLVIGQHFHAVEIELGASQLRGVLGDMRGRGVHLRAGPVDLGGALIRIGAGLGQVGRRALNREIEVGRVEFHEGLAGLDVGVVVDQHAADGAVDPRTDGMNITFQEGVVGGFKPGGVVKIAADARRGDEKERGAADDFAPREAASRDLFRLDDDANRGRGGVSGRGGSGGGQGGHGGELGEKWAGIG